MIVACGFDHAGVPLRARLLELTGELGHEVLDLATASTDPIDYPVKALEVGRAVVSGRAERGSSFVGPVRECRWPFSTSSEPPESELALAHLVCP